MNEKLTKLVGKRGFSAIITGVVFLILLPLVYQFIVIAVSDGDSEEKIKKLVQDQENIAVILIGIGTFLAGRKVILNWLDNLVNPDVKLTDSSIKECDINGFYLILLGSVMEILDQLILHIESFFDIGIILELTLNFPLDLLSLFILGRLFFVLASGTPDEKKGPL